MAGILSVAADYVVDQLHTAGLSAGTHIGGLVLPGIWVTLTDLDTIRRSTLAGAVVVGLDLYLIAATDSTGPDTLTQLDDLLTAVQHAGPGLAQNTGTAITLRLPSAGIRAALRYTTRITLQETP